MIVECEICKNASSYNCKKDRTYMRNDSRCSEFKLDFFRLSKLEQRMYLIIKEACDESKQNC